MEKYKKENELMKTLGVAQVSYLVCYTHLGPLEKKRNKDDNEYFFTLDSVRLPDDKQRALNKLEL